MIQIIMDKVNNYRVVIVCELLSILIEKYEWPHKGAVVAFPVSQMRKLRHCLCK